MYNKNVYENKNGLNDSEVVSTTSKKLVSKKTQSFVVRLTGPVATTLRQL